ncbi:PREDICTED: uncharacterized protein LOC104818870 isoform X1 [Tarenaya hassleriana]|uniref:uncharacterized protein LOC104818870 isoform X2 n=1 Tax=Tarenaya hassleriana TaxID=28532 RepID=UPI00053C4C57|nr:PREDICTED: uncharacterized protein LOC104818870 isoform X2 [Tarenaya hassleriana]XP_010546956.1 PREDICTED: uncharacterized protein LOC104818870 isoform X1 [Tarenaya hassleriana]
MVTEAVRAKAEICHGDKNCRDKFSSWLSETGLPNKLLTFHEIEECGRVKETGFVWIKQRKKPEEEKELRFENVAVCLEEEVSAFLEPNKIKNLRGVKAKELWVWISLCEVQVSRSSSRITFKTHAGFSKSFPLSLFGVQTINTQQQDDDKQQQVQHKFSRTKIYLY